MDFVLDPKVLDVARELTGSRSDDQLGQSFLNLTGASIRRYRKGEALPSVLTLMRLRGLTGIKLEEMVISTNAA